jgi:hypothetical protein
MAATLAVVPPPDDGTGADRLVAIEADGDPRGKRYTDDDREAAYLLWSTTAKQSLQAVGRATGISCSTLGTWHQTKRWQDRYESEQHARAQLLRSGIVGKVAGEIEKSVDVLIEIRDNTEAANRDRRQAAVDLLSLAGLNPNAKQAEPPKPAPRYTPTDDRAEDDPHLPMDQRVARAMERQRRRREDWNQ